MPGFWGCHCCRAHGGFSVERAHAGVASRTAYATSRGELTDPALRRRDPRRAPARGRPSRASVELTPREFSLLAFFLLNPRRVLSKQQILDNVWPHDFRGNADVVARYVSHLRRKLHALGPPLIGTVPRGRVHPRAPRLTPGGHALFGIDYRHGLAEIVGLNTGATVNATSSTAPDRPLDRATCGGRTLTPRAGAISRARRQPALARERPQSLRAVCVYP